MYEYLLIDEDGKVTLTDKEPDISRCCWPTAIRTFVTYGDYSIEYEVFGHDGKWTELSAT